MQTARLVYFCGGCMKAFCNRLVRDERGATSIEYALIATGIAVAIVTGVSALGSSAQTLFGKIATGFH